MPFHKVLFGAGTFLGNVAFFALLDNLIEANDTARAVGCGAGLLAVALYLLSFVAFIWRF